MKPWLRTRLKQSLFGLSFGVGGFWLGSNYAAALAYGTRSRFGSRPLNPDWMGTVQGTLELTILALGLCVLGWIVLDYAEVNHE